MAAGYRGRGACAQVDERKQAQAGGRRGCGGEERGHIKGAQGRGEYKCEGFRTKGGQGGGWR